MRSVQHWSNFLSSFRACSTGALLCSQCRHSSRVVAFLQAVARPNFRGPRSASIAQSQVWLRLRIGQTLALLISQRLWSMPLLLSMLWPTVFVCTQATLHIAVMLSALSWCRQSCLSRHSWSFPLHFSGQDYGMCMAKNISYWVIAILFVINQYKIILTCGKLVCT